MTVHVEDAEIDVFEVGNTATARSSADTTIPGDDIRFGELSERVQDSRDTARFSIDNDAGTFTEAVTIGDRLVFYTQLAGESSLTSRWTGMVTKRNVRVLGGDTVDLDLSAEDFVFAVLSRRFATASFDDVAVSGSSGDIVNTLVSENAPEIDTSQVQPISTLHTVEFQRTNLLDALGEIATRYEAIMSSSDTSLVWEPRGSKGVEFLLDATDRRGGFDASFDDRDMVNDVLVDGARETALDIEQASFDTFETVSDSNRRTEQVDVRKAAVATVEVRVQQGASDEALVVRIQTDDGSGSPTAPAEDNSDIARATVPAEDVPTDDWIAVEMPDNDLPNPDPHILVESDGSTGHDVAYDSGTNELAYRVYYWYPVTLQATKNSSITTHRRHEGRYRRETIQGQPEGTDIAQSLVARRGDPTGRVSFAAASTRAHNLTAGDLVTVTEPRVGADDDYVVRRKRERYDGFRLGTSLELETKDNL